MPMRKRPKVSNEALEKHAADVELAGKFDDLLTAGRQAELELREADARHAPLVERRRLAINLDSALTAVMRAAFRAAGGDRRTRLRRPDLPAQGDGAARGTRPHGGRATADAAGEPRLRHPAGAARARRLAGHRQPSGAVTATICLATESNGPRRGSVFQDGTLIGRLAPYGRVITSPPGDTHADLGLFPMRPGRPGPVLQSYRQDGALTPLTEQSWSRSLAAGRALSGDPPRDSGRPGDGRRQPAIPPPRLIIEPWGLGGRLTRYQRAVKTRPPAGSVTTVREPAARRHGLPGRSRSAAAPGGTIGPDQFGRVSCALRHPGAKLV